uniref:Uncharacterized protein n=1 Tax=Lates calcarifer TaxID=8187 RepID=A0A4W6CVR0_LATCA
MNSERLEGLLTDGYCHVCEAVLLFESQRLSHYEVCAASQTLVTDLERNMLRNSRCTYRPRNSSLVAKSHYEGKVHAKNLRKQGLQPPGKCIMCDEKIFL